ncbi:hypothetical protein AV274_3460 [Blastocystis sp. ATCC 50177/Nand II]|uniref:GOLD domain-containing protein n=1 Tax=Blastocystis sp. subtype 1 (strain ATCC 50177 / NandII) TaxID=478820 RepID=A0A196SF35_BLAHN|nr:hypothetical protein AV274_3460 [Blastocystis sp. ATCC 50177/Nand II]
MRITLALVLFCIATCVIIEVPVGEKRCLYDEMAVGHRPQLYVNVVEGGKHDIHFTVVSIGRDETLVDVMMGTDPSHPAIYRDVDFEIPYFAEYMFCLDNDKTQFSNEVKRVELRLEEGDTYDSLNDDNAELLKDEDIIHIGDSMKEIKEMTEEIKGKQAAYRLQEEDRRDSVMKTHDRVSAINIIEISAFFLFSVIQILVIRRWFSSKKPLLG